MRISTNCPYRDPRREIPWAERDTILCCRPNVPYRDDHEPLCHAMPAEIEVYRLNWNATFSGNAVIRIGRYKSDHALRYLYRPRTFAEAQRGQIVLAPADWARLQDALIAANFWSLDPRNAGRR